MPQQIPYPPQPFDFEPQFTTPVLNVLKYQADALLALTSPKVKHGLVDIVPPTYAQDFQNDRGTTLALKPILGSSYHFQTGQTQIQDSKSNVSLLTPKASLTKWGGSSYLLQVRPSGQYDGDGRPILDSLSGSGRGGQDQSPQAEALQSSQISRFKPVGNVGSIGQYRTLMYAELQAAPRAPLNTIISTGTVQTRGIPDQAVDKDFVDLVINDIKFRAYITSFTDSFNPQWTDLQYIGRQDVLKVFRGMSRSVSLSFKTAAMTKADLKLMYSKLNELIKSTVVGKIDPMYVRAPFSYLTIGNWFVKTPCTVNSIKLDTQPIEYSWDVGDVRDRSGMGGPPPLPSAAGLEDEAANSKQMPMILDIAMEFSILGDANGQVLGGPENNMFSQITQL